MNVRRNEKISKINLSQLFLNANNNFTQTKSAEYEINMSLDNASTPEETKIKH